MSILRTLHTCVPSPLRRVVDPLADCAHLLHHLRVELWSVSGQEKHSGLPLSILCAVSKQEKHYLNNLIFSSVSGVRKLGSVWLSALDKKAEEFAADHSMVVVQVRKPQFAVMRERGYFTIPSWVKGSVTLPLDPKVLHSRSVQSDFKKMRQLELEYQVTRKAEDLQTFYEHMYVPYMQQAHGKAAYIETCGELSRAFRDWEILLVKKDGEPIAGKFIGYGHNGPSLYRVGIRDGNRQYIKDRVVSCVYQLSFQYLTERGFKSAELAWSRSFLNDGVLRYKQKLSQRITGSSPSGLALKPLSYRPAMQDFLRNNPFISETSAGLCGIVFRDVPTVIDPEIKQINKDYGHPGLQGLYIHRFPQAGVSSGLVAGELLPLLAN